MTQKILSNSAITSAGLFARLFCQAVTLILVARILGPENYGVFIAVISVNLLLAPLSGLGLDSVALRESATKPDSAGARFIFACLAILCSAPVLMFVVLSAIVYFMNVQIALWLLLLLAVGDLFCVRVIELSAKIFQGWAKMGVVSALRLVVPLIKLLLALWFSLANPEGGLQQWLMLYFLASALGMIAVVFWLLTCCSWKFIYDSRLKPGLRDGLHFAFGIVATRGHTEVDKPLIMRLDSEYYAGVYAVAFKLYELAVTPVLAMFLSNNGALYTSFQHKNYPEHYLLLKRLGALALIYSVLIGVVIYLFIEPVAVILVGEGYAEIAGIKSVLCWIPIGYGLRQSGEHGLAAQRALQSRSKIQWSVVLVSVTANLLLLPVYGWVVAAWVALLSESLLAIGYFIVMSKQYRSIHQAY